MISTQNGSIRLFRFSGIQVLLHWSWLLVAFYQLSTRKNAYTSAAWMVAEYSSLFVIVLLHEFGHAFASRQVGGESREILLWPFGGIAFVKVPPRPGAELWSIAAGPLVNVALAPLLWLVVSGLMPADLGTAWLKPDLVRHVWPHLTDPLRMLVAVWYINLMLLLFNLLPVYPLDGGQILRSLLWYPFGRARSLQIASVVGFVGIAGLAYFALQRESIWMGIMVLFLVQQCLGGFRQAQALLALGRIPRHQGFACPTCGQAPPGGPLWRCHACSHTFDPFSTRGICPHCQVAQPATPCAFCGAAHPVARWSTTRWDSGQPPVIDV